MWNFFSSVATKMAEAVPNPSTLPPLDEERAAIYAQHKISEADGKLIKKTVDEKIDQWKADKIHARLIDKHNGENPFLPKSLWVNFNPEKPDKIKIYIHCEEAKLGKGADMTYLKALEYHSLKTYAVGIIRFEKGISPHEGLRTKEQRIEESKKLERNFHLVKASPDLIQLKTLFTIHGAVEGRGFLTKCYELGNLESYLAGEKPLDQRSIRRILKNVAGALAYLHDELEYAHFDVKTANILLTLSEDGVTTGKLGDLGYMAPYHQFSGQGTPRHLPPEFWSRFPAASHDAYKAFDGRVFDMWAYGDVMKRMIEGDHFISEKALDHVEKENRGSFEKAFNALKKLYMNAEYPSLDADEPDSLAALQNRILQREPDSRPNSMAEVRDRLAFTSDD